MPPPLPLPSCPVSPRANSHASQVKAALPKEPPAHDPIRCIPPLPPAPHLLWQRPLHRTCRCPWRRSDLDSNLSVASASSIARRLRHSSPSAHIHLHCLPPFGLTSSTSGRSASSSSRRWRVSAFLASSLCPSFPWTGSICVEYGSHLTRSRF
jgi:hypothetical protein